MKAIGKNIIIEVIKEGSTKTKGGVLLSETHKKDIRYRQGKVVSVGTMVEGIKENNIIFYDNKLS